MLRKWTRQVALGIAIGSAITTSSVQAASIKVAVAANFGPALGTIISAFRAQFPTDNVSYVAASTGVLRNQIRDGNTPGYDLFLSADQAAPQFLLTNFPGTVIAPSFLYARGDLELWSKTFNVATTFPTTAQLQANPFAVADPAVAPYGVAARSVLASYAIPVPDTLSPPRVALYANIALTYQAIDQGQRLYGWINKSAICRKSGSTETFIPPSAFHRSYVFNDPVRPYAEILQNGIKVNRTGRTAAQTTTLNNFVNFLQTNSQAIAKKIYYCYRLP
jgi:molybdate transport system substrate-binding protein